MTTRRPHVSTPTTVTVKVGRKSAWLEGPGVMAAVRATGTRHMRCPVTREITVPIDQVADVIAFLEYGRPRRHVELIAVDR